MKDWLKDSSNTKYLLQWKLLQDMSKQESLTLVPDIIASKTIEWIMDDLTALTTFTLSGTPMGQNWQQAALNLAQLIEEDSGAKKGMKLKMAVGTALQFAEPLAECARQHSGLPRDQFIDMMDRFKIYQKWNDKGELFDDFNHLTAWAYRYVLGSCRQDKMLEWTRDNVPKEYKTPLLVGKARGEMIKYTTKNKDGVSIHPHKKFYAKRVKKGGKTTLVYRDQTMKLLSELGAVCGGIARFGTGLNQAFGLPAITVGQPAPAHVALLRYHNGSLILSNSHGGWSVAEAYCRNCGAWDGPEYDAAWYPLMDAAQKHPMFWQSEKFRFIAQLKSNVGLKFSILENVVQTCPQNYGAWLDLIQTLKNEDLLKDASDALLTTVQEARKIVSTVSNIAPGSLVTSSNDKDDEDGWDKHNLNIVDSTDSHWTSKDKTAKFEVELQDLLQDDKTAVCKITSLEIQWWGSAISKDYTISIKGPDDKSWKKVQREDDATSEAPGYDGWTYHGGWDEKTTKIKFSMRDGRTDTSGEHRNFGIRRLVINGLRLDQYTTLHKTTGKELGSSGEVDLVDICYLSSIKVRGSGTVTVKSSTDGKNYSIMSSGTGFYNKYSYTTISLNGLATNLKITVSRGELSKVELVGVRYTPKDALKIQLRQDMPKLNKMVENELYAKIDAV